MLSVFPPSPRVDRRAFLGAAASALTLGLHGNLLAQNPAKPPVRVRVWCEGTAPKSVYPNEICGALGEDFRNRPEFVFSQGQLGEVDAGLSDEALDATDTLVWWGRLRHDDLPEARCKSIVDRVKAGKLGFVALHGSYASKPFRSLLGESCAPRAWREDGQPEHVRVQASDHPIARGVAPFTIPRTAMFAEPFSVPEPETVVLVSSWNEGQSFRSGLTWTAEKGRVVYFRPGHDGFPVMFHPSVRQIIANAALWAAPSRPIG